MQNTPFSYQYTDSFPKILHQLGLSLAVSTYQAGKLLLISPRDEKSLIQLPRSFKKAMGIAIEGDKMAIASLDEVLVLRNSMQLAQHYPAKPNVYDALYMPRLTYYTSQIDIHDLEWGEGGLYAVNTSFSCLCKIDENYNFTPIWHPPFITKLAGEDRCHLNGMAMRDGKPAFATAFNTGNTAKSWRKVITTGGIVMEVPSGKIIAEGLAMPHSPRLYDEGLFVLLSAKGILLKINPATGEQTEIFQFPGFLRGMDRQGEFLFIGVSKIRTSSTTFSKIDDKLKSSPAGVLILHLPTGKIVGQLGYKESVEEIYDVKVLHNLRRPNVLNTLTENHKQGLSIPNATYWGQTEQKNK